MNKLVNIVCLIEINNLKNVCKFYYKSNLTKNEKIYLNYNDYAIQNEIINIKKKTIYITDKWINTFFYKDAYKDNNLFYDYLKSKYRV
tara:strand:- start:1525 stop:1788 length:264 start_codon:yes stop_codon:yes gene_type:complete